MYGKGSLWEVNKMANEQYFRGRAFASAKELPLYLEQGKPYLINGKSSLILLSIRDLIGEEKLNIALRSLLEKYAPNTAHEVQVLNFIDELYQVTAREHHALIDEWMKQIIRYELRVDNVQYKRLPSGPKQLGKTNKIPYLETHYIQGDLTAIKLTLDSLPRYINVDPFLTRPDRNYANNLKVIQ